VTEPQLLRLARAALLLQTLLFAFFVAGSHDVFVKLARPTTTDFASFYAAGTLADQGAPAAAYDLARHRAVEEQVTAQGIDYKYFLNPPVFLLICAALAKLPYLVAFVVFELLTLAFWLVVTARIAGGGRVAVLALLAMPSVYWVFGWGQNSFLTAGLMGAGTLFLRSNPILAGAAFGALCLKPHFGVLLPVALLCGRHWRVVASAAVTVCALVAFSAAVFGIAAWHGFFDMALHARDTIESGRISFAGHIDAGGAMRVLGLGAAAGWSVQALASLSAACIVGWMWWKRPGQSVCEEALLAGLVAGTMIAMPFLLFYDLLMASIAAAWLTRAARRSAWLPAEPLVLALLTVVILLAFPCAAILHLAIGCIVAPALLWCALRRLRLTARRPLPARTVNEGIRTTR
jgi:alpha-1,2-mannosyltransferase